MLWVVDYEGTSGVCRREPAEEGRPRPQETGEHSLRREHRIEGTSKRIIWRGKQEA